jgi:hypothetical protein
VWPEELGKLKKFNDLIDKRIEERQIIKVIKKGQQVVMRDVRYKTDETKFQLKKKKRKKRRKMMTENKRRDGEERKESGDK